MVVLDISSVAPGLQRDHAAVRSLARLLPIRPLPGRNNVPRRHTKGVRLLQPNLERGTALAAGTVARRRAEVESRQVRPRSFLHGQPSFGPGPRLQIAQDFFGLGGRVHLGIGIADLPVGPDEIADTLRVLRRRVVTGTVRQTQAARRVAQKRKVELELLCKSRVLLRAVEADTEDLDLFVAVLLNAVAEPATLLRSTGGIGLGVEPQDYILAPVVGKPNRTSRVVRDLELRRFRTCFQHCLSSCRPLARSRMTAATHRDALYNPEARFLRRAIAIAIEASGHPGDGHRTLDRTDAPASQHVRGPVQSEIEPAETDAER